VYSSRFVAMLGTAAMAVGGLVAAAPAHAVLTDRGAVDPGTGFPSFYRDSTGLALQLCLDPARVDCLAAPADLGALNGEAFYFAAEADAGLMRGRWAVGAAYIGQQGIVFDRTLYQAEGLVPGATYTVTDPYGTTECVADAVDAETRCRVQVGGEAGLDFDGALSGRVGPFLRSTVAPTGFIGDNDTEARVSGSPTDNNFFRVEGPGINDTGLDACPAVDGLIPDCAQTNLFVIQGQVAPRSAGSTSVDSLDFGSWRTTATAVERTRRVRYTSVGTESITVSDVAATGPFTVVANTCATIPSGSSCAIDVRFNPTPGVASTGNLGITDDNGQSLLPLTGRGTETTRPTVRTRSPQPGATGVRAAKDVSVGFSEAVRGVNGATLTLTNRSTGRSVRGGVTRVGNGNTWVLNPRSNLAPRTRYTVRLVGGASAIRDTVNNTLRSTSWGFRTR